MKLLKLIPHVCNSKKYTLRTLLMICLQRSLHNTEDECTHLKDMCEKAQEELQALAEKYQDQQKEVLDIQEKLQVSIVGFTDTFRNISHFIQKLSYS